MKKNNKICAICKRKVEKHDNFCNYHFLALLNIEKNFQTWKDAYENLNWKEYLEKLIKNEENGIWVQEVAKYLITEKMEGSNV
ncbi:MAG: hypothetical protein QXJ17_03770 [Nitrososphaeria archaeon]